MSFKNPEFGKSTQTYPFRILDSDKKLTRTKKNSSEKKIDSENKNTSVTHPQVHIRTKIGQGKV